MADATVGALRVTLGADTARFEDGLKKATGDLEAFNKTVSTVAVAVAAAMVGAAAAIIANISRTIDTIDELGKTAQKIGIPVEQLSALEHAAGLADVSMSTLSTTVTRLSKNMSEVASGAGGPAAQAFEALNVQIKNTDGSLRSTVDVVGDVADRFSIFEDGARKTALAVNIFGKSGAELIPLLNQGKAGLAEAGEEARRFGLIVSTETAQAAERFNDNLKRLSDLNKGVWRQITAEALPELAKLSDALVKFGSDSEVLNVILPVVKGTITALTIAITVLGLELGQLARNYKLLFDVVGAGFNLEKQTQIFKEFGEASKNAGLQTIETIQTLLGLKATVDTATAGWAEYLTMQKAVTGITIQAPNVIKAHKDAIDQFIASTAKSVAGINAEVAAFGLSEGARAKLRISMEAAAIAQANGIKLTDDQKAALDKLTASAEEATNKLLGIKRIEETLPVWQQYQKEVERAREQVIAAGGSLEDFGKVNEKIAERFGLSWSQQSTQFLGSTATMITAIGTLSNEQQKAAKIAQAVGAFSALVASYQAAAQTLAQGIFPFNLIAAASVLAAGLAFAASLKGLAFAKGGGFTVGGGTTGLDSELVAFRATPGEMVDVRRPGQGRGGEPTTINLTMTPRADQFFAAHVREMVYALNKAAPDGYILKVRPA